MLIANASRLHVHIKILQGEITDDVLVDSDTRVPSDCLLDACSEMEASPEVGIMQFSSGVMQVVNTYFENG